MYFNRLLIPLFMLLAFAACHTNTKTTPAAATVTAGNDTPAQVVNATLPSWAQQSNIYEVNIRQYTKEGSFNAFAKSLPRLKEMGVQILWFMPITPISRVDRKGKLGSYYAVQDYKAINPEFGSMADWKQLVKQAHSMGFKVITDWVPNHTGADNGWLTRHPDFFTKGKDGKAVPAFDWTDTRDLNYDNRELRDSMIDAMKWWITETDIDGFRCDVAGEVPDDFWQTCIPALKKTKDVFMLAEGDKGSLHRDGFNCSYPWDMYQAMKRIAAGSSNALAIDSVLRRQDSSFPAGAARLYFTSNHDENSWNKADYGTMPGARHAPFAVFTQTMRNSLPLIYSGQEEPVLDSISFFYKDPIQFGKYARAKFYKTLLLLRQSTPALAVDAAFKKVNVGNEKALYAYTREKEGHKVFVILNLSNQSQTINISDSSVSGQPLNVFMGSREKVYPGLKYGIEPWGYVVYDYNVN
ncbi:MAG TPA: alpha-amylase family glycosyl hydrolase [Chitinophagaceae bacterium]|nr:alpha-amylase family glycosyl hydrolase [Chitinophagaceae bacterium]